MGSIGGLMENTVAIELFRRKTQIREGRNVKELIKVCYNIVEN